MDYDRITEVLMHPFNLFFDPTQRLSLLYMATALIVAIGVYYARKRSLAGLLTWLLPKEVLLHPSAKADYVMFFINKSVVFAIYASIIIQSEFWFKLVQGYMGPPAQGTPSLAATRSPCIADTTFGASAPPIALRTLVCSGGSLNTRLVV